MIDYFCTIGQELADEIDQSSNPLLIGDYMANKGNKTMKFAKFTKQHIRDGTNKTKTSKDFGNDIISSYFLKLALPYIIKPLAYKVINSLEKRETARAISMFKNGEKISKENYRPISVLPVISKLFERLVYNQLNQHLQMIF